MPGLFCQIPNDHLTSSKSVHRNTAINHQSVIILLRLFFSLERKKNQSKNMPNPLSWRDQVDCFLYPSWLECMWRSCNRLWLMTHTYQQARTYRNTLHSCAQSRWLSVELWERSLSSVTSGNNGWSVECVTARLIRGTEPETTSGIVRPLRGVRFVPEAWDIKFQLHTCVSCCLNHHYIIIKRSGEIEEMNDKTAFYCLHTVLIFC